MCEGCADHVVVDAALPQALKAVAKRRPLTNQARHLRIARELAWRMSRTESVANRICRAANPEQKGGRSKGEPAVLEGWRPIDVCQHEDHRLACGNSSQRKAAAHQQDQAGSGAFPYPFGKDNVAHCVMVPLTRKHDGGVPGRLRL